MKFTAILLGATAIMLATGAHASTTLDNFNRADAGTLGNNWTQRVGSSSIVDDKATGSGLSLATYNGGIGNEVSFNISAVGSGVQYVAAVLGYGNGDNLFVKVQQQGGTGFNSYGFYTGDNDYSYFGSLSDAFSSGLVDVKYTGKVATLTITPDGGTVQTYTHNYGYTPTGTGIGLGFYGAARADNFGGNAVSGAVPEPATWAMMIAGFGMIGFAARRRQSVKTAVRFA